MSSRADSVSIYKTRRILAEISMKKGRGTELVSLYIPPKKPVHEVVSALREEHGTAANIKSDLTRTHVQDALVKTMQRLKLYRRTPGNGLVIFCGALPTDGPGSEAITLYEVIPPKPVQTYLYRCDDHFNTDPLRDMLKEEKSIGIISVDTSEAGLGIVKGNRFEVADVVTSGVSGKHRAGGQSARRFERVREMELTDYFHRVAKHAAKAFLDDGGVTGLIVSGPGPTKDDFRKGEYLDYRLQNSILGVLDTSYAGAEGVRETLEKAEEILQDLRLMEERRLVKRLLQEVRRENGLVAYGLRDVFAALERRNVDTLLVSEDVDMTHLRVTCKACGVVREADVERTEYIARKQQMITDACGGCGGKEYVAEERDLIEYLDELATGAGARVEVISSKTEEGTMLKSFGGVAALLRYRQS